MLLYVIYGPKYTLPQKTCVNRTHHPSGFHHPFQLAERDSATLTRNPRWVSPSDCVLSHICCSTRKTKRHVCFLTCPKWFLGGKFTPEKCGTKYPFNWFTYNNRIFHNQTNSKNILTMRDEICDFVNLIKKIFAR